jgi:stress response protein YsnF
MRECLPIRSKQMEEGNVMRKQVRGRKAYPPHRDETKGTRKDKRTLQVESELLQIQKKQKAGIRSMPTPHLSTSQRPRCVFEW